MSDETYDLVCHIEGQTDVFMVTASPSTPIFKLKKLIREESINDHTILAKDLRLRKVRMTMASDSTTNSPAGGYRKRRRNKWAEGPHWSNRTWFSADQKSA